MPEIVNIQDDIARLEALGTLTPLLSDKTTGGNILWATDAYAGRGTRYVPDAEITPDLITGDENAGIIRTRAQKAAEQQSARTRRRAEVYTPLWVCRTMCDNLDAVWFRRKDGFNRLDPETGRVRFPKNRTWTAYVKSTRLEITCGEGPFLTSRYDAPTGTVIPVRERVGLLDRKLRAVSENTDNERDWLQWAVRAFQSSYGYEFQGDSLLIARVNALMTFAECFHDRWGHFPGADKCKAIADIIAWNWWQMDGLTDAIPYRTLEKYPQMVISGWAVSRVSMLETPKRCHIYDWRKRRKIEYLSLKEKEDDVMKFDFIIGNPPYQEENDSNNRKKPIYDRFMDESYKIADVVELITPARFLFNAGYTPKEWNQKMLNDEHFRVLYYEPDRDKVFPGTDIKGGVAVSLHNCKQNFGKIVIFTPLEELNGILHKILLANSDKPFLSDIISARGLYRFTPLFFADNPTAVSALGKGTGNMIASNAFERLPDAFSEAPTEDGHKFLKMLGLVKKERVYRYIRWDYVIPNEFITSYNVLFPKANGSGEFGEVLTLPAVSNVNEGATDTFINIGQFSSKHEAESAIKYIKTKFLRTLLGIKKVTQDCPRSVWQLIPVQDFTPDSDIDWSKPVSEIDRQLYAKYRLDEKEIAFIESHVKEMT